MQVTTEPRNHFTLVRAQVSRLDAAAAPAIRSTTADLANQAQWRVVFDLSGVDFVDSSGLGALIHMHKTLEPHGRLVLCAVQPKVAQLFKVTRLERVFVVAVTEEDAAQRVTG